MPVAPRRRAERGFTLIEILVVLIIIAIIAAVAIISVGVLGSDREIELEGERLTDTIALLQDQAQLEGRDYGLRIENGGYEFQRFDGFEQHWATVEGDPRSRRGRCRRAFLELVIEGRPILLKQAGPGRPLPQLVAYGSGEATPYRLTLVRKAGARLALVGGLDGSIEIERGDETPCSPRGFTLIEVVVALAIVAVGMLAVFTDRRHRRQRGLSARQELRGMDRRQPDHRDPRLGQIPPSRTPPATSISPAATGTGSRRFRRRR